MNGEHAIDLPLQLLIDLPLQLLSPLSNHLLGGKFYSAPGGG